MQYNQPFDQPLVPNAPYVDGNATTGQPGSIPRGGAIELPQREIINALAAASLMPINGDLTQLAQAMSIGLWLGAMGGSANAIADVLPTLATTSDGVTQYAIPALVVGMTFHGIIPATNTGAATLTLTGFGTAPGAKPIFRRDGTPVQAGDLPGGAIVSWRYDGAGYRVTSVVQSDILALIAASGAVVRVTDTAGASTAQSLVGTASPAITVYGQSQVFLFTSAAANTGAAPNGNVTGANGQPLGALPFVKRDGSALAAGDIPAGATFLAAVDAAGAKFRILGIAPSDILSLIAANTPGRLLNVRVFGTAGTSTYTPTAGTTSIIAEVQGAGGGAGGTAACTSSQSAASGGGGAGARAVGRFTSGFAGAVVTVGAGGGGTYGASTASNGGSSSVGSLISAGGGGGSVGGGAQSNGSNYVAAPGNGGSATSGGNIFQSIGQCGSPGFIMTAALFSGAGGGTVYGGAQAYSGANSNGQFAATPGAGGGGAATASSGSAYAGGSGAPGIVIIWEYA